MKLTKRQIDSLSVGSGQKDYWDEHIPGFGIRISQTKKVFVLMYRINGKLKRMTLGQYGVLTLDQARDMATGILLRVRRGEDPAAERLAAQNALNIEDLCRIYMERHAIPFKRSWRNDARIISRHILPIWGKHKAHSITRSNIAEMHQRIGKEHPYEANRTLALLRKMFNFWKDLGFLEGENPASRIKTFHEEKRDRFIKPNELPVVLKAILNEPDPRFRAYFLVKILTGARKSELLTMKWDDLDFAQGTWRKPRTKADRSHTLPLPTPALKILNSIHKTEGNPYVFPGTGREGHLINVSKAWGRIRRIAGLADVRVHDIRRTLGSWLAEANETLTLIGKALDHSSTSTTAIYARLDQDKVRQALEDNATRMLKVFESATGSIDLKRLEFDTKRRAR